MKETKKNIALVGMPGCFKTTAGSILADKLGRAFYDTDTLYAEIYGTTIAETFQHEGEAVFRAREAVIVAAVCRKENAVLATGGGVVLREDNIAALTANCMVVELCASAHTLYERVKNDRSRPLFADMRIETVEAMQKERQELYRAAADFSVNTEQKTPEIVAEEIIKTCGLN